MFCGQYVDYRGAKVSGFGAQSGYGHLIAAFLAFGTNLFVGPPDKRMEPENSLYDYLQQIDRSIESNNVA